MVRARRSTTDLEVKDVGLGARPGDRLHGRERQPDRMISVGVRRLQQHRLRYWQGLQRRPLGVQAVGQDTLLDQRE